MDAWLVLECLVAIVVLAVANAAAYLHYWHLQYDHIPGPPRTFWMGNFFTFANGIKEGKFLQQMVLEYFQEYGHTVHMTFIHKHIVMTTDPESIKDYLVTGGHLKSKFAYRDTYKLFGERFFGKGLVSEMDNESWSHQRAIMNPAFNRKYLVGLMDSFNDVTDELMNKLCKMADGKTQVSMHHQFCQVTLDAIGKAAFGMDINSVNETKPFCQAITTTFEGFAEQLKDPWVRSNPFRYKYRGNIRKSIRYLRKTGDSIINERMAAMRAGEYTPDDILTYIIHMADANVDKEILIDHFVTFFIAGQETTANTISFLLQEVSRRPDILKKIQAEVDSVLGERPYVTYDDVGKLEYLGQVIKETLRLFPPVAVTFREPSKRHTVGGYTVPAGTMIMFSTYASHRYNADLEFNPDRFHKDNEKQNVYSYFPFSLGPRNCIGQTFAKIEAKVILAKFMQRLLLNLDPNQSFEIQESTTLRPKGGVKGSLTLRDSTA